MDDVTRTAIRGQQIVLVLQGGGALGAYQAGVFQGLHEAGVEPHWIVGTSIGAINAALIAGNAPDMRVEKLREFWRRVGQHGLFDRRWSFAEFASGVNHLNTLVLGVPGFFQLNPLAAMGLQTRIGVDHAAFYSTEPLRDTLQDLVGAHLNAHGMRLTVGAVNVCTGEMKYFDSRDMPLGLEHVMASAALPPAFPAVEVDEHAYWDGGVYSNTPVEVVLDDNPRRDSLIFMVNVWHPRGAVPTSIWDVLGRQKDIQYASRVNSHVARQGQIHRLRHIIRELAARLPEREREDPRVRDLIDYGCHTTMHLVSLLAPRLEGDDYTKDIDFDADSIRARWDAGYADVQRALAEQRWSREVDPLHGVVVHEAEGV
jgi:NTE family protein